MGFYPSPAFGFLCPDYVLRQVGAHVPEATIIEYNSRINVFIACSKNLRVGIKN
jgi:hypothetical protein